MSLLVPIFKSIHKLDSEKYGFFDVGSCTTIDFGSFFDERMETLSESILDLYTSEKNNSLITVKNAKLPIDGYRLKIKKRFITIYTASLSGCYYAFQTIKELARVHNGLIPAMEILDYPDLTVRGFMLDISRSKVPQVKTIYQLIDLLSLLRYNHLELYVEGFSFEYKSMPFVNEDGNHITVEEYKEIEKYANDHFIDLVPNQNGFGHMAEWLKLDQFKDLANVEGLFNIWGSNRHSTTLNPLDERSFNLVKQMYDDMLPHSNSKYFNMNFDEPYELGYGKSKEECDKLGREKVFTNYFNKLAKVTKAYGKRPMLWGDVVIKHPEAIKEIDSDAILIDWGYTEDYPFLENAKMLQKIKRPFMLAPGTSTWSAVTSKYKEMLWTVKNAAEACYHHNALGLIMTDWGDFGHLQYYPFSLPGIIYASLLSWNYNKTSEHLIKEYLAEIVGNPNLASLIIDLSNYADKEDRYSGYSTKLFQPIITAELVLTEQNQNEVFKTRIINRLLSENEVDSLNSYFQMLRHRLNQIKDDSLVYQELSNSLRLLEGLLEVNIFLKDCFNNRSNLSSLEQIEKHLQEYLSTHYILWKTRNKEAGFVQSASRIERLIKRLKNLKEEATNYE